MDDLTLWFAAPYVLFAGVGIVFWCIKRYEVAVFLVALSPWISAIFIPNYSNLDAEQSAGSYIRISLLLLMGGVGVIKFCQLRSMDRGRLPFHFILLGVFLLFALISTSYSIDPLYTFVRSFSFIAVFGFLLGFNSWLKDKQRLDQTLNTLFLMACFGTMINLISLVIVPEWVWRWKSEHRFQGLLGHPNTMGSFCMLSYPALIWKYRRCDFVKKWMVAALIIIVIFLHLLTGSRGSLIASVFGICVWFMVLKKIVKLLLCLGMIGIAVFFVAQLKPTAFERDGDSASFTDLTGRPEFWYGSYMLIMERPILGYGYAVEGKVWSDPRFYKSESSDSSGLWGGSPKSSLHNGYLSIAIGVGIVGFLVWCVLLFIPLWQCRILPYSDYKAFIMSIMLMCLLLNSVESAVTGVSMITSIGFWIVWVIAGRVSQKDEASNGLLRRFFVTPRNREITT